MDLAPQPPSAEAEAENPLKRKAADYEYIRNDAAENGHDLPDKLEESNGEVATNSTATSKLDGACDEVNASAASEDTAKIAKLDPDTSVEEAVDSAAATDAAGGAVETPEENDRSDNHTDDDDDHHADDRHQQDEQHDHHHHHDHQQDPQSQDFRHPPPPMPAAPGQAPSEAHAQPQAQYPPQYPGMMQHHQYGMTSPVPPTPGGPPGGMMMPPNAAAASGAGGMPYPPMPPHAYGYPPHPYYGYHHHHHQPGGMLPTSPAAMAQMELDRRLLAASNGLAAYQVAQAFGQHPGGNGGPGQPPPGGGYPMGGGDPAMMAAHNPYAYAYAAAAAGGGMWMPNHPGVGGVTMNGGGNGNGGGGGGGRGGGSSGGYHPSGRKVRNDKKTEPEEPQLPVPTLDRAFGKVTPMTCDADESSLSGLQNLARQQIEYFEASDKDVTAGARGRNFPISPGQVGIRCKYCKDEPLNDRGRAACYFPTRYNLIYQTAINMTSTHLLQHCPKIPQDIRDELIRLKDQRSTAGGGKGYWAKTAKELGIIETAKGLRFKE